jgi:hypothetical protein
MTDTTMNARQREEQIERIRRNPDLNQDAKRRMIQEVHEEASRAGGGGDSYWLNALA